MHLSIVTESSYGENAVWTAPAGAARLVDLGVKISHGLPQTHAISDNSNGIKNKRMENYYVLSISYKF